MISFNQYITYKNHFSEYINWKKIDKIPHIINVKFGLSLSSYAINLRKMQQHIVCSDCGCSKNGKITLVKCKTCFAKVCCCISTHKRIFNNNFPFFKYFDNIRKIYVAALGIEILCIISAEIGENIGLYVFGFNMQGIIIAYVLGYALAGFTTFMTILGRYDPNSKKIGGCCSSLEQNSDMGFLFNLFQTFQSFAKGFGNLIHNRKDSKIKDVFKASLIILVTAESACILTAETVGIFLYQYSLLLAIPLALIVGTFTIVAIESYRKVQLKNEKGDDCSCKSCNSDFIPLSNFKRKWSMIKRDKQFLSHNLVLNYAIIFYSFSYDSPEYEKVCDCHRFKGIYHPHVYGIF